MFVFWVFFPTGTAPPPMNPLAPPTYQPNRPAYGPPPTGPPPTMKPTPPPTGPQMTSGTPPPPKPDGRLSIGLFLIELLALWVPVNVLLCNSHQSFFCFSFRHMTLQNSIDLIVIYCEVEGK